LTLVEKKAIVSFCEKFGITQSLDVLKRNIVTTDIDLNELVGKEFRIGDAICSGIELCFPCMELCKELGKTDKIANEMFLFLKSSGGIRADIIASGKIEIQNRIQEKN
jgi:MOSC domain-containing protein YiiM